MIQYSTQRKKLFWILLLVVCFYTPFSYAQMSNTLYHMQGVPQNHYLNPAFQPKCNIFIGFPALSSVSLGYDNNSFDFNDIIFKGSGEFSDSLITPLHPSYNTDLFLDKLHDRLYVSPEVSLSLLAFGFRTKEWYFTFDLSDINSFRLSLPKDLFGILLQGNGAYVGKTADFSNFNVDINYYRQYSVGASKNFTDKLTVGLKGKLLFGKANFSFDDVDIGLYTDPETYNLLFHSKFTMNSSGPYEFTDSLGNPVDVLYATWLESLFSGDIDLSILEDTDASYLLEHGGNLGFGVDLGMEYRLNDRINLSASVIDLGFIKWKNDVYSFKQDGKFEFQGIDISEGILSEDFDSTMDVEFENLGDSIVDIFELTGSDDPYTTWLPTKIYIGGTYRILPNVSVGLLSRSEIYDGKIRQSVTLSANTLLANFFSFSLSYSIMNYAYNNMGIGIGIRGGPLQLYFVTDRIPLSYSMIEISENGDTQKIPMFFDQHTLNFRFGLNLTFGCREKGLKDKPLVPSTILDQVE